MAITNTLSYTLQSIDATGVTIVRRVETPSDVTPTTGQFASGSLPDTSQHTITLPVTQVRQLLLRNTHTSAIITAVWTPNGGAEATILKIGPGDIIGFWHQNTGTNYGISSLKLTSDTASTTYELFIGG